MNATGTLKEERLIPTVTLKKGLWKAIFGIILENMVKSQRSRRNEKGFF